MAHDGLIKRLQAGISTLPAGLLVATLYAIACWATRQISLDQFFLPSGVRVAVLLASPMRMWPYLLLGEYAYFAELRLPLVGTYGLNWVLLSSVYQFPVVALIVYLHRRAIPGRTDAWLLTIAAAAALAIGVGNLALMRILWPSPLPGDVAVVAARFVIGHYMAIITVAPLAALLTRRIAPSGWSAWLYPPSAACLVVMLMTGYGIALLPAGHSDERAGLQLLMAAPVILLTCIHGWRGAAVGVPLMNLIVHFTTPVTGLPGSFDAATFRAQQGLALVSTSLIALGSITSHYRRRLNISLQDRSQAMRLAKSSFLASEKDLRARAQRMRHIVDHIDFALNQTVEWLQEQGHKQFASSVLKAISISSRNFREQASLVYPIPLEQVGLYLALQGCGISEAWHKTGRVSCEHFSGDPCLLSTGLQLAAYRAITEAVSLLLEHESGQLQIRARCGRRPHLQGIVMTVKVLNLPTGLAPRTAEIAIQNLTARANTYGGRLQCHRNTIRLLLVETRGSSSVTNQCM
ncbi:MASE1 domain-containing protein [Stenotrophomonas sp. AB1(2024)]|uniref:MASE1 domain-containing protein n=1 Tax=Stenotrophomonas sp. AB1(2024) TaxID=3132215 RepID=UPI0030B42837